MSRRWSGEGKPRVRGAALVELVMVTPVLLLLFAGGTEMAWAFRQYDLLTCATRSGVRFAAAHAAAPGVGVAGISTTLASQTGNLVVYGNTAGGGVPVLPGFSPESVTVTAPDAKHVLVQATYQYQPLFAAIPFVPNMQTGFVLHSSAYMAAL